MKKIIAAVIFCLCILIAFGCRQHKQVATTPATSKEVQDRRITVRISRVRETNEFLLTAEYTGKLDMIWWVMTDAELYNAKGARVPRSTSEAGTSWFHWVEDNESTSSHFANYRRGHLLTETLILRTKGLPPGQYRAVPLVSIFEKGKDADPHMKDPYYAGEIGIKPGKVIETTFTIK